MHSSDQGSTGETSKMPIATDIIREGFSGKQNCLRQTQELLGGIVNPQLSDLKEPGTSKLDWRLSIDIIGYCTCIIDILRYFFILQSLTTSKMRKFQTLKLSPFHKVKTCWTENWWSSWIMSNFFGDFF